MFFIVNKTKSNLVIADIGLKLGPRQAADLDKRVGRSKAEKSKHLKKLVQTGVIEIKRKDGIEKIKAQPKIDVDEIKKDVLLELKDHIKDGIKEGMAGVKDGIKEGMADFKPGLSEGDLAGAIDKLAAIMSKNQGQVQTFEQMKKVISDQEIDVNLDDETLSTIHARAMDKIADKIDGSITYEEKVIEDSVIDNAEELEGLLG